MSEPASVPISPIDLPEGICRHLRTPRTSRGVWHPAGAWGGEEATIGESEGYVCYNRPSGDRA